MTDELTQVKTPEHSTKPFFNLLKVAQNKNRQIPDDQK